MFLSLYKLDMRHKRIFISLANWDQSGRVKSAIHNTLDLLYVWVVNAYEFIQLKFEVNKAVLMLVNYTFGL